MDDSGYVPAGTTQIHYDAAGNGKAVVFLHAAVADSRMWRGQMGLDGYRTIAFDQRDDLLQALEERARPFGARLELLDDGSALAVLDAGATPLDVAVRAAGCARALRANLPGALIGICCLDLGAGAAAAERASTLFERTVGDLARDAMAAVFAGVTDTAAPPPGGIRVDEQIAVLLERDHPIVRSGGGIYLRGEP